VYEDFDRHLLLEFCEMMKTKIDANSIFLSQVIFSGNAFELDVSVNKHNCIIDCGITATFTG